MIMETERPGLRTEEYHAQKREEQLSEHTRLSTGGNPSETGSSLLLQSYSISGETMSRQNEQNHSPLWKYDMHGLATILRNMIKSLLVPTPRAVCTAHTVNRLSMTMIHDRLSQ